MGFAMNPSTESWGRLLVHFVAIHFVDDGKASLQDEGCVRVLVGGSLALRLIRTKSWWSSLVRVQNACIRAWLV